MYKRPIIRKSTVLAIALLVFSAASLAIANRIVNNLGYSLDPRSWAVCLPGNPNCTGPKDESWKDKDEDYWEGGNKDKDKEPKNWADILKKFRQGEKKFNESQEEKEKEEIDPGLTDPQTDLDKERYREEQEKKEKGTTPSSSLPTEDFSTVGKCDDGLTTQQCFCTTTNCYYNDSNGATYKFNNDPDSNNKIGETIIEALKNANSAGNNTQVDLSSEEALWLSNLSNASYEYENDETVPSGLLYSPEELRKMYDALNPKHTYPPFETYVLNPDYYNALNALNPYEIYPSSGVPYQLAELKEKLKKLGASNDLIESITLDQYANNPGIYNDLVEPGELEKAQKRYQEYLDNKFDMGFETASLPFETYIKNPDYYDELSKINPYELYVPMTPLTIEYGQLKESGQIPQDLSLDQYLTNPSYYKDHYKNLAENPEIAMDLRSKYGNLTELEGLTFEEYALNPNYWDYWNQLKSRDVADIARDFREADAFMSPGATTVEISYTLLPEIPIHLVGGHTLSLTQQAQNLINSVFNSLNIPTLSSDEAQALAIAQGALLPGFDINVRIPEIKLEFEYNPPLQNLVDPQYSNFYKRSLNAGANKNLLDEVYSPYGCHTVECYAAKERADELLKIEATAALVVAGGILVAPTAIGAIASVGSAITTCGLGGTLLLATPHIQAISNSLMAAADLHAVGLTAIFDKTDYAGYGNFDREQVAGLYTNILTAKGFSYGLSMAMQSLAQTGETGMFGVKVIDFFDNQDDTISLIECTTSAGKNKDACYETLINASIGPKDMIELPVAFTNWGGITNIELTPKGTRTINDFTIDVSGKQNTAPQTTPHGAFSEIIQGLNNPTQQANNINALQNIALANLSNSVASITEYAQLQTDLGNVGNTLDSNKDSVDKKKYDTAHSKIAETQTEIDTLFSQGNLNTQEFKEKIGVLQSYVDALATGKPSDTRFATELDLELAQATQNTPGVGITKTGQLAMAKGTKSTETGIATEITTGLTKGATGVLKGLTGVMQGVIRGNLFGALSKLGTGTQDTQTQIAQSEVSDTETVDTTTADQTDQKQVIQDDTPDTKKDDTDTGDTQDTQEERKPKDAPAAQADIAKNEPSLTSAIQEIVLEVTSRLTRIFNGIFTTTNNLANNIRGLIASLFSGTSSENQKQQSNDNLADSQKTTTEEEKRKALAKAKNDVTTSLQTDIATEINKLIKTPYFQGTFEKKSAEDIRVEIANIVVNNINRDGKGQVYYENLASEYLKESESLASLTNSEITNYANQMVKDIDINTHIKSFTSQANLSINTVPVGTNIFAVGDVHGDLEALVGLLNGRTKNYKGESVSRLLVDNKGNWIGGSNDELILTGDLFDRAPNGVLSTHAAVGVMKLQQSAGYLSSGTPRVKVLLGNHDVNAILAYESEFHNPGAIRPGITPEDFIELQKNPELVSWMKNLPAMYKKDEILFMHSDTTRYLDYGKSVEEVNNSFKKILNSGSVNQIFKLTQDLTTRGHFNKKNVDTMLSVYGGNRIVHGHSQKVAPTDDRVINIDYGLSKHYSSQQNRGEFFQKISPSKFTIEFAAGDAHEPKSGLIGSGPAQIFENWAQEYIYDKYPNAVEDGVTPKMLWEGIVNWATSAKLFSPIANYVEKVRTDRIENTTKTEGDVLNIKQNNNTGSQTNLSKYEKSILDIEKEYKLIPLSEKIQPNSTERIRREATPEEADRLIEKIETILNDQHQNTRFLSESDETVVEIQQFANELIELINSDRSINDQIPNPKVYVSMDSSINAYALPDGSIVVYQGLINTLNTKDQLFAALAHECSHFEDNYLSWSEHLSSIGRERAQEYRADFVTSKIGKLGYDPKSIQYVSEILNKHNNSKESNKPLIAKIAEKIGLISYHDNWKIVADFSHGSIIQRPVIQEFQHTYVEYGFDSFVGAAMPRSWKKSASPGYLGEIITSKYNKKWRKLFDNSPEAVKQKYLDVYTENFNHRNFGYINSLIKEAEYGLNRQRRPLQKAYNSLCFHSSLLSMSQDLNKLEYWAESILKDSKDEKNKRIVEIMIINNPLSINPIMINPFVNTENDSPPFHYPPVVENFYESFNDTTLASVTHLLAFNGFFNTHNFHFNKVNGHIKKITPDLHDLNADFLNTITNHDYWNLIGFTSTAHQTTTASIFLSQNRLIDIKSRHTSPFQLNEIYKLISRELDAVSKLKKNFTTQKTTDVIIQRHVEGQFNRYVEKTLFIIDDMDTQAERQSYWERVFDSLYKINNVLYNNSYDNKFLYEWIAGIIQESSVKNRGIHISTIASYFDIKTTTTIDNFAQDMFPLETYRGVSQLSKSKKEEKAKIMKNTYAEKIEEFLYAISKEKIEKGDSETRTMRTILKDLDKNIQGNYSQADALWIKSQLVQIAIERSVFDQIFGKDIRHEALKYDISEDFVLVFSNDESYINHFEQLQEQYREYFKHLIRSKRLDRLGNHLGHIANFNALKPKSFSDLSNLASIGELIYFVNNMNTEDVYTNFSNLSKNNHSIVQHLSNLTSIGELIYFVNNMNTEDVYTNFSNLSKNNHSIVQQMRLFIEDVKGPMATRSPFGCDEVEYKLLMPLIEIEIKHLEKTAPTLTGVELFNLYKDFYPPINNKQKVLDNIAKGIFEKFEFQIAHEFLQTLLLDKDSSMNVKYIHYFLQNHIKNIEEYRQVVNGKNSKEILSARNNDVIKLTALDTTLSNLLANLNEEKSLEFLEAGINNNHGKTRLLLAKEYIYMTGFAESYAKRMLRKEIGDVKVDELGNLIGSGASRFPTFNEFVESFYNLTKERKTVLLFKLLNENILTNTDNIPIVSNLITNSINDSKNRQMMLLINKIIQAGLHQTEQSTMINLGISRGLANNFLTGDPHSVNNNDSIVENLASYGHESVFITRTDKNGEEYETIDFKATKEKNKKTLSNLLSQEKDKIDANNKKMYPEAFELQNRLDSLNSDLSLFSKDTTPRETSEDKIEIGTLITEVAKNMGSLGVRFLQVFGQYFDISPELQKQFSSVYDDSSVLYMANLFQSLDMAIETLKKDTNGITNIQKPPEGITLDTKQAQLIEALLPRIEIVKKIGGGSINTTYLVKIKNTNSKEGGMIVVKISNPNVLMDVKNSKKLIDSTIGTLKEIDSKNSNDYEMTQRLVQTLEQWNSEDIMDKNFLIFDPLFSQFYPYTTKNGFTFNVSQIDKIYNRWVKIENNVEGYTLKKILTDFSEGVENQLGNPTIAQQEKAQKIETLISDIALDYIKHLNTPITLNGRKNYILHSDLHVGNIMINNDLSNVTVIDRNYYLILSESEVDLVKSLLSNKESDFGKFQKLTNYLLDKNNVKSKGLLKYWSNYLSYFGVAIRHKFNSIIDKGIDEANFLNAMMQKTDRLELDFPLNVRLFAKNMAAINKMLLKIGDDTLSNYLNGNYQRNHNGQKILNQESVAKPESNNINIEIEIEGISEIDTFFPQKSQQITLVYS